MANETAAGAPSTMGPGATQRLRLINGAEQQTAYKDRCTVRRVLGDVLRVLAASDPIGVGVEVEANDADLSVV